MMTWSTATASNTTIKQCSCMKGQWQWHGQHSNNNQPKNGVEEPWSSATAAAAAWNGMAPWSTINQKVCTMVHSKETRIRHSFWFASVGI
jgi:hypothetical protein